MIETKKTKQYFSINNAVASNNVNINRMEYNFNNSTLTNIQTSGGQKCMFTPVNMSIDWDYKNISEAFKNNKISFITYVANDGLVIASQQTFIIADNSYSPLTLCTYLNTALNVAGGILYPVSNASMGWIAQLDVLDGKITIRYTIAAAPQFMRIDAYPKLNAVNVVDAVAGTQYNAVRWLGLSVTSKLSVLQIAVNLVVNGVLTSPPYNPLKVDFKTLDNIRIHSNIAKRFFEIRNGRLSENNVFFELIAPDISFGSSWNWEPLMVDIYQQEILSNFDNIMIELKDRNGNLIEFASYCNFNMTFYIEREIELPDYKERLKNLQNLNQLSSV